MDDPQIGVPYPWETVVETDRGYETLCWVDEAEHNTLSRRRRLLTAVVGYTSRAKGTCFIHLCERFGEINRCVRPDHIRIGTVSENVTHHYALRRAAGVPKTMPAEARAKISASMVGKPSRNKEGKNQW